MKVYKDKQYLVFDYENGKTVKYDLANKETIGIRGSIVSNLKTQLKGYTINDIINCCSDTKYAEYLKYIKEKYSSNHATISNIGTILSHISDYPNIEQLFSAGISNISHSFKYNITDIPSGLIKICRQYGKDGIVLSNTLVDVYKQNPDACNIAFKIDFISLSIKDINDLLHATTRKWINREYKNVWYFLDLIDRYGYNAKSLLLYIDHLKTFEAMDGMTEILRELCDYCRILSCLSPRFDRYPKHFLTTHRIATRNYNRLKKEFDESAFSKRVKPEMEYAYKGYKFIYPRRIDEIKDEAVQQHNCVASYIDDVIDGNCDILFMRSINDLNKSLVTVEVKDGKICQYKQHYNYPCTTSQHEAIQAWNKWYQRKTEGTM